MCVCRREEELSRLREFKLSAEQSRDDIMAEIDDVRLREVESLEFTKRMTSRNSQLQAENLHLSSEVSLLLMHSVYQTILSELFGSIVFYYNLCDF